ncbi:CLIP-associating protein 1 [Galemys pyrenaicus]|uniref:CLIP-associating protein 1 n=1 Tax=Galemys pyrenaicus TaxID=202257 RepID=A0A8J6AS79_GALPY|nr:CLIP-associating protein 1 [Galemys pyrenaicus]
MEPRMESCLAQVLQKDVGKRLQVGQELIDYFSDKQKSADLEHDQTMLDKLVDGLATSWVNSSNYKDNLFQPESAALANRVTVACSQQVKATVPHSKYCVGADSMLPTHPKGPPWLPGALASACSSSCKMDEILDLQDLDLQDGTIQVSVGTVETGTQDSGNRQTSKKTC